MFAVNLINDYVPFIDCSVNFTRIVLHIRQAMDTSITYGSPTVLLVFQAHRTIFEAIVFAGHTTQIEAS